MSNRTWPRCVELGDHTRWRPEWTSARPLLWWYLTFEQAPAVAEHATRAAAALAPLEQVDVPPSEWLHLTLCEVGFVDQVEQAQVDQGARAVAQALRATEPTGLRLGPVNSLHDAVVLEAHPQDRLRSLRATVRGAMASAGVDPRQPDEEDFWPHVTIGYLNARARHRVLLEAIGHPATTTTPVTGDRLQLVEVTRTDRHYRWRARASVATRGSREHSTVRP